MGMFLSRGLRDHSSARRGRIASLSFLHALIGLCAFGPGAEAGEATTQKSRAPVAKTYAFDWAGLYVGGHVGYGHGNAEVTLLDQMAPPVPGPPNFSSSFGSLIGGVQLGYNYILPSRVLVGLEADMSFLNALAADDLAWSRLTPLADSAEKIKRSTYRVDDSADRTNAAGGRPHHLCGRAHLCRLGAYPSHGNGKRH